MKRILCLVLVVGSLAAGCRESSAPAATRAPVPPAAPTSTTLASWPVHPDRTGMLSLGTSYVAWVDRRRAVVVADVGSGERQTVHRTAYAGGEIGAVEPMGRRVLVVDVRPGESASGPPAAWRLVAVDRRSGRWRVLTASRRGAPSWAPVPVSGGAVAGWVTRRLDRSAGGVAHTWRPGSAPRRWGRVGRASLVGITPEGVVLSRYGGGSVRGLGRDDLELRGPGGVRRLTRDGLVVEADLDGSTLTWSERADRGHQSADPVEIHALDLGDPAATPRVLRQPTGYALRAGDGFVLWSGHGLRVAPLEGGPEAVLSGHLVPGPSYQPDVRGDRVAYVIRTADGPRLVVARVGT
ncbi:hypothetical protein [Nocardioides aquiterrae]|uniref:Uncharacterized protein n=1 Tax=Nocardioides aquiterrae TaxID=203799 RepID=A0ABP4F1S1_9ACTN